MGMQQITFSVPDEVAEEFAREVPPTEQSDYLTGLLRRRLHVRRLTEQEWAAAAEAANNDPETQQIQADFNALPDTMT
jgi:hypothetical protein